MEKILTVRDLTKRWQCSRDFVCVNLRKGTIPQGMKIGKLRRWRLEDIEAFEQSKLIEKKGA